MAEVLSNEEIDRLLIAINVGMETKRPDKFSKEQIQAISYIHETFANLTTYSLSAHIRSMCHVHVLSTNQFTYEEFIHLFPIFAALAVIDMNPLKGSVILGIDKKITFAIIDRICGGSGDGTKFQQGLTDIEKSIMDNIIVHILGNLREAWNQVLDIHPQMKAINTDPQYVRIVSPNETVVLVTLKTKIGEAEGIIGICIPCPTIEPVMEKLSNWYWNKNQDNTPSTSSATEKPAEEKNEYIPKENEKKNFRSFDYLNSVDSDKLSNLFYNEHPQVIALVLAHMEADKASVVLQNLKHDIQSDVFQCIATMDKVKLEIASEIERILENKLIALSSDEENYSTAGGIDSAVKILNLTNQYFKKSIINEIEKVFPELAEEIQKRVEEINNNPTDC